MSYTKNRVISSVRTMLQEQGHNDHPALVEDAINHVYSQLLIQIPQSPHNQYEIYTKNYKASIALDSDSNRYYVNLPVAVVNLPRKGGGVVSVQSEDGKGFRYYPVSEQEWRLTANIESGLYNRYYGYYVNRNKILFTRDMSSYLGVEVRLSLVTQFKDFEATDEVLIPGGQNYDLAQLSYDYITQKSLLDLQIDKED